MPTTINLLRHAEAFNNIAPPNYVGINLRDAALTDNGYYQAAQLRPQLHKMKFDAIYCSPLQRCRQTLKAVYPRSVYLNVSIADGLLEQPYGSHVCNHRSELADLKTDLPNPWTTDLVLETNPHRLLKKSEEYQIILDFVKMLLRNHPDQTVLLVTHGRWISRFIKLFCKMRKVHINNCECIQVVLGSEMLSMELRESGQSEQSGQSEDNAIDEPNPKRARF